MRKPIIVANWKMHKTTTETRQFINDFIPLVKDVSNVEIVIAPPYTSLALAAQHLDGTDIKLSSQNAYYEKQGAYTGEVSADMLVDCGCSYVILGHSERRQHFNETDTQINRKIKSAQSAGLGVILCVGETLEEREGDKAFDVVSSKLDTGLDGVDVSKIVLSYEPIWAIGTGKNATPEQAQEVHSFIREKLKNTGGNASELRIIYGGSVKPDNISLLMKEEDIDGALVGGASLDPVSFSKIVKFQ